jgi:hypothetical protein
MEKLEGAVRQLRMEKHQLRQLVETTRGQVPGDPETANLQENNQ